MGSMLADVVFFEIKKAAGIYCIHCSIDDAWYIGKSTNVQFRKGSHLRELKAGSHVNGRLQRIFNTHGEGDLLFFALEYCDESVLMDREQFWYDHFRLNLNLNTLNYGETVFQTGNRSNHPSRAGIKLKPSKGGHTGLITGMRVPGEYVENFSFIVEKFGISRSDWIKTKIDEDYARLFNLTDE